MRILTMAADEAAGRIDDLAAILLDCVAGGASVGFMADLDAAKAQSFWRGVADGVARGERVLIVAEAPDGMLAGTVQVVWAVPDNQPHRGDVAKMLVHRRARKQGVGAMLLRAAEDAARMAGRTVLVLDTVTGSDAERLYARGGWTAVGSIPDYALFPDGRLCATTVFYKTIGLSGAISASGW